MDKVHSEYENHFLISSQQFEKKRQQWQQHLHAAEEKLIMDPVKWKSRLDKLDAELVAANDLVYQEKAKLKHVIQKLIDEANKTKKIIMNYADSLKEENINQRAELKAALQEKHTAA